MSSYNYCSNVPARTSNIPDVIAALWSFCRSGGGFKHRSFHSNLDAKWRDFHPFCKLHGQRSGS